MSQVAFLLFSLLSQNVTFVSVLTLDFTGSGKRETLFSTGVRFYLWHFVLNLVINNISLGQPRVHRRDKKVGPTTCLWAQERLLLLAPRADEEDHSLALEGWHIIGFAVFSEVGSEAREEEFALLLEDDGPSAEEDISFHFVSFFEELDSVLELEVVIVVIGLRTETDLLHLLLFLVRLRFLLLFLLSVKELLVVNDAADRRSSSRSDLDEIKVLLICNSHCLLIGVDTGLYIFANEAHLLDTADFVVDTMRVLFNNSTTAWSLRDSCYMFNF